MTIKLDMYIYEFNSWGVGGGGVVDKSYFYFSVIFGVECRLTDISMAVLTDLIRAAPNYIVSLTSLRNHG